MRPLGLCRLGLASALSVLLLIKSADAAQPGPPPLPEAPGSSIGYPTVAAALEALRARPGVVFTIENGWTIATDEAAYTIWSFARQGYPAYPAVVKRQVVRRGTTIGTEMNVLCEATKAACDDLVRTFAQLTGFDLPH
jgi:hypothetical protein